MQQALRWHGWGIGLAGLMAVADARADLKSVFSSSASPAGVRAMVTLADKNKPDLATLPIVIRTNAAPEERLAADELAAYFGRSAGITCTVATATGDVPARAVCVGPVVVKPPKDLAPDGYLWKFKGLQLHIVGGSPRGTLYGVYGLLEDAFGCRWWSATEEEVPTQPTLSLLLLDQVKQPPFSMHDLFNREAQGTAGNFHYKSRSTSWEQFSGGHTLCPTLKPYAEKQKEFLPMNAKGERAYNDLHMCYTAAGMPEALAEALGKEVVARGMNLANIIYFAGMGDWYGGMCECPACKAIYEEETWTDPDGVKKPGYSATLLRMINRTAELLDQKYPGVRVGTFAYMSLEAPPAKTKPRDNVVIWVPRLRHCTVLAIDEGTKNKSFARNVARWVELAPGRVYIWEYGINFSNFLHPFPCLRSLSRNIALYHQQGVRGIMIQGNYVSGGGDLTVMKNYVWRKLLWDPTLDPEALIRDFCLGYYGPASAEIQEYVNTLEAAVRQPTLIEADEFCDAPKTYLTPDLLAKLGAIIERAAKLTKGDDSDPYYRRVREAGAGVEATLLWTEGPVEERDGKLFRKDLDAYTFPRAEALLKYIRGASPREWGNGRSYHLGFLTMHGGPLYTLIGGPLKVKVASAMRGQLWQVSYQDAPLLAGATDDPASGASYYTALPQSNAAMVTVEGECGVGHWSADTKQIVRKTFTVAPDGKLRIGATARQVAADANATASMSSVTPYLVGTNAAQFSVATTKDGAQWAKVDWALGSKEAPGEIKIEPDDIKGVRIRIPDKVCYVEDMILAPRVTDGKLKYDAAKGTLTVTLTYAQVKVSPTNDTPVLDRELRCLPYPATE